MCKCVRDYTVINSQPSIEAFENLMNDIFGTFGVEETIDDMFYYGVFCKPQNYANFDFEKEPIGDMYVPEILTDIHVTESERINYVKMIIRQIMHKDIKKPEWMKYVELNENCNEYGQAPSTFLSIEPKSWHYEALAQRLIEFLYSPNLNITMVKA